MRTADFRYHLPAQAIAQRAIEPRDSARLLVTSTMADHRFSDLVDLLDPGDLLVVNRTRVRAARIRGRKRAGGGAVELLLTRRLDDLRWQALARPARRLGKGVELALGSLEGRVVSSPARGVVTVELSSSAGDVEELLPSVGEVPLPPYFAGRLDDDERYQTVFATHVGSAAAPTAGLHFTHGLVARLLEKGIWLTEVELEVGLDTFRPIAAAAVESHEIHRERFVVPESTAAAVTACRAKGGRVVAVGTTVVRALESVAGNGRIASGAGETDLFITPGYRLRAVDAVLTNFHAPATTLVVLVASLLGPSWKDVYETALARGYRFLSFGDVMLVDEIA